MTQKKEISIHIGEYHASKEPLVIRTLLGSCVAVCLYDKEQRIGGMNHILRPGRATPAEVDRPARFCIDAIELLIRRMISLGGRKEALVAKVFGGANVITPIDNEFAPGLQIVASAKEFLAARSIKVRAEHTGGTEARIIYFHTDSGYVYLRHPLSSPKR